MAGALSAHIGAWAQRWPGAGFTAPNAPSIASPVTSPAARLSLLVELLIDGVWIDVSSRVKYEDRIVITRGRANQQGTASSSTCRLTFKNPDRYLSPRNTLSPYYPFLTRGSRLRVTVNPGSGASVRFTGRVPEWPPRWTNGDDRSVSIEARGALYELEQNDEPAHSSLYRRVLAATVQPLVYWPCEDADGSTTAASALPGGTPMVATGGAAGAAGVRFGQGTSRSQPAYTGFEVLAVGTAPLASLREGGALAGDIPASAPATTQWTVQFVGRLWAFTGFAGTEITLARWQTPGGTFGTWEVRMLSLDGGIQLLCDGATVLISPATTTVDLSAFRVTATQNGANVDTTLRVSRVTSTGESGTLDTDSRAGTLTMPTAIQGNPDQETLEGIAIVGSENQTNDIIIGHITVYDTITNVPGYTATTTNPLDSTLVLSPWPGWTGEQPTARFLRACADDDIDAVVLEHVADDQPMGPEGLVSRLALLRACEDTSEGLIDETRTGELRLASRTARWVPDVLLTLDYAHPTYGNQVYRINPTDDKLNLVNDWTIGRDGGSSAHAEQLTGPLNVNTPDDDPEGVGRRRRSATLSLYGDEQASQHAYARLHVGTVDELRYPLIAIALHRNPELIPAWLAMDINARLRVLNPPADVGPDTIAQYAEGYVETLTQVTWDVRVVASPTSAGEAWRYSDVTGAARYDCAGSSLASDHSSSTTTLNLTITDNCVWAHADGDYLIRVGGEDVTVTAAGAASGTLGAQSQALTVTRSVNGATLAHLAGTAVRLKNPARYAL